MRKLPFLEASRSPQALPEEHGLSPVVLRRICMGVLVPCAVLFLATLYSCDRPRDHLEAAYRHIETHPINEFAGLPPAAVFAKTER